VYRSESNNMSAEVLAMYRNNPLPHLVRSWQNRFAWKEASHFTRHVHPGTLKRQLKVERELNLESRGRVMTHSVAKSQTKIYMAGCIGTNPMQGIFIASSRGPGWPMWSGVRCVSRFVVRVGLGSPMANFGGVFLVVDHKSLQSERHLMIFCFCWFGKNWLLGNPDISEHSISKGAVSSSGEWSEGFKGCRSKVLLTSR
jgi:hypothetical protein